MEVVKPRETQYAACFSAEPIVMGPMTSEAYRRDPQRFAFQFARYKFVARMLGGLLNVAEIGCADAFASPVVAQAVGRLHLYDFDSAWKPDGMTVHDIVAAPLPERFDAIYMLDVIEHLQPEDEPAAMRNICASLFDGGIFIAGAPTLEFQPYASEQSRLGHVNCRNTPDFKREMQRYFRNVFMFGMNDECINTGFSPMSCYHFALCCGPATL